MDSQKLCNHRKRTMPGMVFPTRNNGEIRVVEYSSTSMIKIEFLDTGYVTNTTHYQLTRGQVRDKSCNRKSQRKYYNVGYLGDGGYTPHNFPRAYKLWRSMIMRCYDGKYQSTHPTYVGCSVAVDWHNFQNFCEWCINQKQEIGFHLDKDIIVKHNKMYSSDRCLLVPGFVNFMFANPKSKRGKYPIGVRKRDHSDRFEASCNDGSGSQLYLGTFDSAEVAFDVYKNFKEDLIKRTAQRYKGRLDPRAYRALMNYKVEITD